MDSIHQPKALFNRACKYYAQPKLASKLLEAQDTLGVNINLVLLSVVLTQAKVRLAFDDLMLLYQTASWHNRKWILPIRSMRRNLSGTEQVTEKVYQVVKRLELAAEELLYELWQMYLQRVDMSTVDSSTKEELLAFYLEAFKANSIGPELGGRLLSLAED